MRKVLLQTLLTIVISNPYEDLKYDQIYVIDLKADIDSEQEQNSECSKEMYWDEHIEEWSEMHICN